MCQMLWKIPFSRQIWFRSRPNRLCNVFRIWRGCKKYLTCESWASLPLWGSSPKWHDPDQELMNSIIESCWPCRKLLKNIRNHSDFATLTPLAGEVTHHISQRWSKLPRTKTKVEAGPEVDHFQKIIAPLMKNILEPSRGQHSSPTLDENCRLHSPVGLH